MVGITNFLPKLRSNYIFHAQVVVGPFYVSRVDFSYLREFIKESLGFNKMNPFGVKWEEFQKKWKDFDDFFFPIDPKPSTLLPIKEAIDEGEENTENTTDLLARDYI